MQVFVTGGSGFVGREVIRQLRQAGHSIRVLARSSRSHRVQELVSRYAVGVKVGDVLVPGSLAGALDGTDAVIHLIGIISEVGGHTFEMVHTQGTRNIVAAAQAAGVKRFIHMSALGTRPDAAARYHQSKWAAEEIVRHSSLDYTIFRPSLIYGPEDHFVNLFARIVRVSPAVPVIGSGRARFQPVSVKAVAKAFVKSLTEPKSISQTYDLCGPESLTSAEMLDQILVVMGRKRWKLRLPLGLAWCQAVFLEFIFPWLLRKAPPFNRDQLIMLEEDNAGDPRGAERLFGLEPVLFREGIARYLRPED